jgi:uncharacterized protein (TIGR00266 family)
MDIEILYRPAHSVARVRLGAGEQIEAEAGAMVSTDSHVQMETAAGGFKKGLKRLFGGESFFRNTFTATGRPGEVLLAPALAGDMTVLDCGARSWFIQSTSYVAGHKTIELDTKVGGFKTFFAGEGIFVLRASGQGKVIVAAFGALERIDVAGEVTIDTGHLVAWEDSPQLTYRVTKAGAGWIASYLSGEGLVCKFEGRGTVWIQTRNPSAYGALIGALLPPKKR